MNGLSISTAPLSSPTAAHSGPPPPYSCAPATSGSATGLSGYISPPESTTRRSTRDEKDSPGLRKSLPSIHEALGDKSIAFSAPLSASSQPPQPTPSATVGQAFPDGPRGPVNPFSQSSGPPPVLKDVFAPSYKPSSSQAEIQATRPTFSPTSNPDPRQPVSQHFGYPGSPRSHPSTAFRSSSLTNTSFNHINEPQPPRSPPAFEQPRSGYSYPQYNSGPQQTFSSAPESFQFTAGPKPDEHRAPYSRPGHDAPYGDTVKRHLDVFDTEMGLNEVRNHALVDLSCILTLPRSAKHQPEQWISLAYGVRDINKAIAMDISKTLSPDYMKLTICFANHIASLRISHIFGRL